MGDSYFVFGVLAMVAMVIGVRTFPTRGEAPDQNPTPTLSKPTKPRPGGSRARKPTKKPRSKQK
jgi:hypothetical protein